MITELINLRISPMPRSANINGSRKYRLPKADEPLCKQRYRTTVHFYDRFLNADGTPTRKNVDNIAKILLDAIARAYGLDDSYLDWDLRLVKCDWAGESEPYCVVTVERL